MEKQEIKTSGAPGAIGPYSQAIKIGDFIFCSGQIPIDPKTSKLITSSITEETHQVLQNLKAVLEAAGGSLNSVVKTTIFLKNLNDFQMVNEIYGSYFKAPFPSRATIEVSKLPKDVSIEIEAIAKVLN